jgi:hypothetical protein
MAHTYLKLIEDEEHYLLAKEIAELFGIKSSTGKIHIQLVAAVLKRYLNNEGLPRIFYWSSARRDLYDVYPRAVYTPAVTNFLFEQLKENDLEATSTIIAGKKFSFKLEEETKKTIREIFEHALQRNTSYNCDENVLDSAPGAER